VPCGGGSLERLDHQSRRLGDPLFDATKPDRVPLAIQRLNEDAVGRPSFS
jgi:hypothetical protein